MILANSRPGFLAASVTSGGAASEVVRTDSVAEVVGTDSLPELHDAASMMNSPVATNRFAMAPFIRVSVPAGPLEPPRSDWPALTARALRAGRRHRADEQKPRAPSDAVVERTVREGSWIRNRLGDALDEEPGVGERIDDRADWAVVEAHLELSAALAPGIGEQHRLEVRSGRGREHHVRGRVVCREQQHAAGPEDAGELTKRRPPIGQIVQDERRGHDIERPRLEERHRGGDVGYTELRPGPESPARPLDQPRIEIDTNDARPALEERLRQPAARAADVEHTLAANLARHAEDRRPIVADLDRIDSRVVRVQIRHLAVIGERAPAILAHQPIMQHEAQPCDPSASSRALSARSGGESR